MLALLRRASFWTTFYGLYFNHHLHTYLQITFLSWSRPSVGSFHVLHLHLSFRLVGTYSCSCCTSVVLCVVLNLICSISVIFQYANLVEEPSSLLFSLHHSSLTCCVWTVAIRVSGVDHLIGLLLRTTSCCWMPPWLLYLATPLVLVAVHLNIFHLLSEATFTPQYAQWLYYTPLVPMQALLQDPSCVLLIVGKILTCNVRCVQLCHRHIHIKLEVSSEEQLFW